MRRFFALIAAASVMATASYASAAPRSRRAPGPRAPTVRLRAPRPAPRPVVVVAPRPFAARGARDGAARLAQRARGFLLRAQARRARNAKEAAALRRLRDLNASVQRFRSFGAKVAAATLRAELARIEARFAALRAEAAWLASFGDVEDLARCIAEMRRWLATSSVAAASPATTVYTNGASVSWYQAY